MDRDYHKWHTGYCDDDSDGDKMIAADGKPSSIALFQHLIVGIALARWIERHCHRGGECSQQWPKSEPPVCGRQTNSSGWVKGSGRCREERPDGSQWMCRGSGVPRAKQSEKISD